MTKNFEDFPFLEKLNLKFVKVLQFNERKKSHILLVKKNNNEEAILKIISDDSDSKTKNSFKTESDFYNNVSNNNLLSTFMKNENYILFEKFLGTELSSFLQKDFSKNELEKLLEILFDAFDSTFLSEAFSNKQKTNLINDSCLKFEDRLSNLLASGPKGTQNSKFEKFILRQIFKFFSAKIKKFFFLISNEFVQNNFKIISKFGHNDLHCNNILINDDLNIKIIDFENTSKPGFFLVDMLYFFGTFSAICGKKKKNRNVIQNSFLKYLTQKTKIDKNLLTQLLNLFYFAAQSNSRFRFSNSISFLSMLNFIYSIFKLKLE